MTATPDGISNTSTTPGTAFDFCALKLFSFPPNTGERAMRAVSMPGMLTSRPKSALPSVFSGVSSRRVGFPMSLKSFGCFKTTSFGGSISEAFSTS